MKKNNNYLIISIAAILILLIAIITTIVFNKEEKWTLNDMTVTKGKTILKIGDTYNYDETNNGSIKDLTDTNWKVLGVSDKGNLLIMSTSNVEEIKLGDKYDLALSQNDYINGIDKLNNLAQKYGHGDNAISARSITVEDINKLTKYSPIDYGKDSSFEYNNEVTYYWFNEISPVYEGKNGINGTLTSKHNDGFIWYDEETKEWNLSKKSLHNAVVQPVEKEKIATIKSNWYSYENQTIEEESEIFKMLFRDEEGNIANYWLANQFTYTANMFVGYGYRLVNGHAINYRYLVYSPVISRDHTAGLRVIVEIK